MKKRKYLYRLAMSILFIVILPLLIAMMWFGKYSYGKVEATSEEYQGALMDFYMGQLDQMVISIREHASKISADSKVYTSIFWNKESSDTYWYYQAINELKNKYHNYPSSAFRIYYYDDHRMMSEDGAQTLEQYFQVLGCTDVGQEPYLADFFDEENYQEFVLCMGGTEHMNEGENKLLIGFCTTFGKKREKVMLLYEYEENDLKKVFDSAYIEKGFEGSLWNENGFSFFFANYSKKDYRSEVKSMMATEDGWQNQDKFMIRESSIHPIKLIGYLNEYSPRNMTLTFFDGILIMMEIIVIVMLLGYLLALYIAYKPVHYLTTRLDYTEGNELEAIGKELDARSQKIEEQEMLLLDLLLNNLLYKVPISRSKLKLLGIAPAECYTVFLLEGYVLHDAESRRIISEAERRFNTRMFVLDLEGENRSVFVLFLNDEQSDKVKDWMISLCESWGISGKKLAGGKIVRDVKEIWSCMSFCEEELNRDTSEKQPEEDEQKGASTREMKRIKLREDILAYVDEHYRDTGLSQASIADRFGVSTYTLSRIFKNDVGIGFVTYVNAKRVEYAKELLLTTKETVHDIAFKSGFDNDNNFFKVFKANTGMSPTTFRDA